MQPVLEQRVRTHTRSSAQGRGNGGEDRGDYLHYPLFCFLSHSSSPPVTLLEYSHSHP